MSISAGCAKRSSQIPADRSTSRRFAASAIDSRYQSNDETRRQGDNRPTLSPCLLAYLPPSRFMTALNIIFAVAFLATLGWAIWLWRHRMVIAERPVPPHELFTPIFHAAISALDSGLVVVDQERQIRYLNHNAATLLGVENED